MDINIRKIPVFVFPTSLKFYLLSKATHKQLLTLYNPYDFPVRFKVLCTTPNKYAVTDPEGSIGPRSCVDIVVRHVMPITANCNITDKFRITMQDHSTKQVLGKRDIEAILHSGEGDTNSNDGDNFHSLPHSDVNVESQRSIQFPMTNLQRTIPSNSNNLIAIIAGLVCILALLLPTQEVPVESTKIPAYLHISINLKLVFAYVLGLVSMVVFRP